MTEGEKLFRLRVLSYEKVNMTEVDNPENLDKIKFNPDEGDFWIVKLQLINLNKAENFITYAIALMDAEDFEFRKQCDNHLSYHSNFAKTSGLSNFWGHSFIPKIKHTGAISFFLPKDENAEYFISIREGTIKELYKITGLGRIIKLAH